MSATDQWTLGLALYGALLATGLALWELYKYRRDLPRVRVSAFMGHQALHIRRPEGGTMWKDIGIQSDDPPFLAIKVVNDGRHPVVLERVGGVSEATAFSIDYPPARLPHTLEPNEVLWIAGEPFLAKPSLTQLGVWDTTGRRWLLSRWALRQLKRQAQDEALRHPELAGMRAIKRSDQQ